MTRNRHLNPKAIKADSKSSHTETLPFPGGISFIRKDQRRKVYELALDFKHDSPNTL